MTALVPYLTADDLADDDKRLLAHPANLFRALANSPSGLRSFLRLGGWAAAGSSLDARLRELVVLATTSAAGGDYERAHHARDAVAAGLVSADEAAALSTTCGDLATLDRRERLAVETARAIVADGKLRPDLSAQLQTTFDAGSLTELVLTVSFYAFVSMLGTALDLDLEPDYTDA